MSKKSSIVEGLGPGAGEVLPVVGIDRGVKHCSHAALGERVRKEVLSGRRAVRARWEIIGFDEFQQSFVTGQHCVRYFQIHDVPVDIAGLDLGADLSQAAVVVLQANIDATLGGEGLMIGLRTCPGIGAAPRNDGQRFGACQRLAPDQEDDREDDRRYSRADSERRCAGSSGNLAAHPTRDWISNQRVTPSSPPGSRTRQSVGVQPMRTRSPSSTAP